MAENSTIQKSYDLTSNYFIILILTGLIGSLGWGLGYRHDLLQSQISDLARSIESCGGGNVTIGMPTMQSGTREVSEHNEAQSGLHNF